MVGLSCHFKLLHITVADTLDLSSHLFGLRYLQEHRLVNVDA